LRIADCELQIEKNKRTPCQLCLLLVLFNPQLNGSEIRN